MLEIANWKYCELLKTQLQASHVPVEKLSEGLCSPSMLSRICNGERTANKMLRDRLMQRLGLSDDGNENFIFGNEYEKWKMRQKIVVLINEEDIRNAEMLLDSYEKDINNNVEQQFCEVMRIQILQIRDPKCKKLAKLYESALKLTVPNIDKKEINALQLSTQELDLALEYVNYCHPDELDSRCNELIKYVESSDMDEQSRAKIIPKIIYYQSREKHTSMQSDFAILLKKCNCALECLRDAKRLFFFWELLKEREWIYDKIISDLLQKKEIQKSNIISKLKVENEQWIVAIAWLYQSSNAEPKMKSSCYLYLERNTNCINDVVRKRRIMLGMTKKQLSEGICSEKTIGRLENNGEKAQLLIIKELFEKLKMSGEYQRRTIVTENSEVYRILEKIVRFGNDMSYDNTLKELEKLEKRLSMKEPLNKQYIERQKAVTLYQKGEITIEEATQRIKKALAYTLPFEKIKRCSELYLTHGEMNCIQNLAYVQGTQKMNVYYKVLFDICEEYEKNNEILQNISMYEFIMTSVASVFGNIGEYGKSSTLNKKIIRKCLQSRRLGMVVANIYSIAWNCKEMKGDTYSQTAWEEVLRNCATLFHIEKDYGSEKFMIEKLHNN